MKKLKKLPAKLIVQQALNWGAESVSAMIDAHRNNDGKIPTGDQEWAEHVAYLCHLHKSMVEYRKKRFGWKYDPTSDATLKDASTGLES